MKHHKINQGDELIIWSGSFTLTEIKMLFNALAFDIASDKAANIESPEKDKVLAKLGEMIESNQ